MSFAARRAAAAAFVPPSPTAANSMHRGSGRESIRPCVRIGYASPVQVFFVSLGRRRNIAIALPAPKKLFDLFRGRSSGVHIVVILRTIKRAFRSAVKSCSASGSISKNMVRYSGEWEIVLRPDPGFPLWPPVIYLLACPHPPPPASCDTGRRSSRSRKARCDIATSWVLDRNAARVSSNNVTHFPASFPRFRAFPASYDWIVFRGTSRPRAFHYLPVVAPNGQHYHNGPAFAVFQPLSFRHFAAI